MSYSRSCGVSLAACEAQTCRCDKSHVGALGGREKPAQRPVCGHCNDLCDYCGEIDGVCGRDFPCCNHDKPPLVDAATDRAYRPCDRPDCPICLSRNALQTTHNESREGC